MSPRELAFKEAVEAWEAREGPMSDNEFTTFKERWKKANPKPSAGKASTRNASDASGAPGASDGSDVQFPGTQGFHDAVNGKVSTLADMMAKGGRAAKNAAGDAVMAVNKAGNDVLGPVAPFSDAQADLAEAIDNGVGSVRRGARNIGDWLSRAYHKVAGDDQQQLLPEYGGKSPEVEELDMSVPANRAYVKHLRDQQLRNDEEDVRRRVEEGNPVGDAIQAFARRQPTSKVQEIDLTTPEGRALVEFYQKQSEAPARLGSKENPLRLPPIDL